jgi:succinate-semialdehyde dehydrogenase/glutarate-semialdehyde dehydrogenase
MCVSRLVQDDLPARVPGSLFVDGKWVASSSGATFAVTDPATGDELARVADATPSDGLAALDAAAGAADEWARTAPRDRAERLRAAFEAVTARADDLALLISLEMGKPLGGAYGEVAYGAEFLRWYAEEAVRISGHYGPAPGGSGRMIVTQRPVGPCYLITPWNFPLAMATRKIAPALAAGCTVVVKPAELTPLTTLYLAALLAEAGVPPGVVNVVTTSDPGALSGPLLADPRLRKLSFTGSTAVGRRLLAAAADGVLRTSMELGGNAPFLVFADADIPAAVEGAMVAKFRNIGQACTAANRFVVHESVAEEFVGRLCERVDGLRIGPGTEKGVTIGPLINAAAVAKTTALVDDAVRRGATVLRGGTALPGPGNFFPPTVLTGVSAGARLLREEIFGPVAAVVTFRDEDEAVAIANDTEYGLVGYAYTRDLARSQRLIDSLHTGMVGINVGMVSEAAAPFGGIKQSGLGREGGPEGIREYLTTKYALTAEPGAVS